MQSAFQNSAANIGAGPAIQMPQQPVSVPDGDSHMDHEWPEDDEEEIPAEDLDADLQAVLEASKNDQ